VLVALLNFTPAPEKTIAIAAKLCYSDSNIAELEERVKGISYDKFLGKILGMGHLSVLEHASFTFGVEGISRATSHQLVRHRIASYSQQSQRYVVADRPEYVIPPTISCDEGRMRRFTDASEAIFRLYKELVDEGVPAEDARYLLPNAASTKIIITMNARALIHFFRLRGCERAQWEIREMAVKMLKLARSEAPVIFKNSGPACVEDGCSEGAMTCGHPEEIRKKFKNL
jgi:thymidylate synthase (FAD)